MFVCFCKKSYKKGLISTLIDLERRASQDALAAAMHPARVGIPTSQVTWALAADYQLASNGALSSWPPVFDQEVSVDARSNHLALSLFVAYSLDVVIFG